MQQKRFLPILNLLFVMLLFGCGTTLGSETEAIEETVETEEVETEVETDESEQNNADEKENIEQEQSDSDTDNEISAADATLSSILTAHFIDVGQSDATLITFSQGDENYTMLIDAGDWNRTDVTTYLHEQKIEKIDILVGTHEHADHIGQMDDVINNFSVEEVWMSGGVSTSQTFKRVMTAIEESNVNYDEPRTGDTFDLGPLLIEILHPSSLQNDPNSNSIAMKLTYGDVSFILTGDAYESDEKSMINQAVNLDADVLKLGHHGSNTSSSTAFIEAVSPSIAIYSAGANNSYGHPHIEVIKRVESWGSALYGTDVNGTIIIETDGNQIDVLTRKDGTISPGSSLPPTRDAGAENNDATNSPEEKAVDLSTACIDINTASTKELQKIKHVGQARAEAIIELRPFESIDDLTRVNGIAAGRLNDIKNQNIACTGG